MAIEKAGEFEPAQESGENTEEEHKKLPSSYCTILFNDVLVGILCPPYRHFSSSQSKWMVWWG
jgi:hypothetical protein